MTRRAHLRTAVTRWLDATRDLVELALSDATDDRGQLVALNTSPHGIPFPTWKAWAEEGRLRAHRAERGKLVAWERDLVAAIEAEPVRATPRLRAVPSAGDELDQAIAAGDLR